MEGKRKEREERKRKRKRKKEKCGNVSKLEKFWG
jgi:hypothetical protein